MRYKDFLEAGEALGLVVTGALGGVAQDNIVAASSATRDVVMKLPRGSDNIYGEAIAMGLLHSRGLSPRVELCGGVLVIDRVRPGTMMESVWETADNKRAVIKEHLDHVGELIGAISEIESLGLDLSVENLLRRDVRRALGVDGDITASILDPAVVAATLDKLSDLPPLTGPLALCHGDLRSANILWDGSRWVIIDPRAVFGDPCADVGRMAACVALDHGWALEEVVEELCAGSVRSTERSLVWARAWLLQTLGHHWRFVAQSGPGIDRYVELLTTQ